MVRKLQITITAFLLLSMFCMGQDEEYKTSPAAAKATKTPKPASKFDWNKVYLGGGLGLQFGSITLIDLSPIIGYRFSEDLSAGVGISYQYLAIRDPSFSSNTYGGGPFARYMVYENLFVHVEYQILNSEYFVVDQNQRILGTFREDVHYFWVGGGYRQQLGGNSFLMLTVLYNLNDSELSIYPSNPIIRMGVSFGL